MTDPTTANKVWLMAVNSPTQKNNRTADDLVLTFHSADGVSPSFNISLSTADSTQGGGDGLYTSEAASQYYWETDSNNNPISIPIDEIGLVQLAITGDDAWLPTSIFVIFADDADNYMVFIAYPNWRASDDASEDSYALWFSTDEDDARSPQVPTAKAQTDYIIFGPGKVSPTNPSS